MKRPGTRIVGTFTAVLVLSAASQTPAARNGSNFTIASRDHAVTAVDALHVLRVAVGLESPESLGGTRGRGSTTVLDRDTLLWALTPPDHANVAPPTLSYREIVESLPYEVVNGLAQQPDANGALGRNKTGYIHARFQTGLQTLSDHLLYLDRSPEVAESLLKSIEYAFLYQNPDGSFVLQLPSDLAQEVVQREDLASATSFFLAALGTTLVALDASDWFATSAEAAPFEGRLGALRPSFRTALDYLLRERSILETYDAPASNRLLFDAQAFYLMGRYVDDEKSQADGERLLEKVIDSQHADGYFPEHEGFDSSYNGVALRLGLVLYAFLPDGHPLRYDLWNALVRSARWQAGRIMNNGEISTMGNTRVHEGGETFLGDEKGVAWKDTALALYMMHVLTRNPAYLAFAEKVVAFYR